MATERIQIIITESGSLRVQRGLDDIGESAKKSSSSVEALKSYLKGLAAALTVQKIVQWADAWTAATGQIKVATQSTAEFNAVTDKLFDAAQRTGQSFTAMTEVYSRTARAGKELGVSQQQIIDFTENIGKALTVQGTNAQQASGALMQLGQAMGSGTVRAEEYNSILEGAPYILQVVANNMEGVNGSMGALRAKMVDGKLSSREFFDAFLKGSDEINSDWGQTSMTFAQALTVITNSMTRLVGKLNESSSAGALFATLARTLSTALNWLGDHATEVVAVMGTLAAAFVSFKAAMIVSTWVSWANGATLASFAVLKVRNAVFMLSAHPLVAIATALGAAAAAVALYGDEVLLGVDETTTLKDVMRALAEEGSEALQSLGTWAGETFKDMAQWGSDAYNDLTGSNEDHIQNARNAFQKFFEGTGTGWAGLARKIARILDSLVAAVRGFASGAVAAFTNLPDVLLYSFQIAANGVLEVMEYMVNNAILAVNIANRVAGLFGRDEPLIKLPRVQVTAKNFSKYGSDVASAVREGLNSQNGAIEGWVVNLFDKASVIGKQRVALEQQRQKAENGNVDLNSPLGAGSKGTPLKDAEKALKEGKNKLTKETEKLSATWLKGTVAFKDHIMEAAKLFNVDPNYIQAIIRQETGWMKNSEAQRKARSPAGALGVMQVMPKTAEITAKKIGMKNYDPFDPRKNIIVGTAYLSEQLATFNNDPKLAAAAYNAGPHRESLKKGQIPKIKETQNYVKAVMGFYKEITQNPDTTTAPVVQEMIKLEEQQKKVTEVFADLDFAIEQTRKNMGQNAAEREADNKAAQLQQQLAKQGIEITEDESRQLLEKVNTLQELQNQLDNLEQVEARRAEHQKYMLSLDNQMITQQKILNNVMYERGSVNEALRMQNELLLEGVELNEDESAALVEKLTQIAKYDRAIQIQNNLLQESVDKREQMKEQLEAINNLLNTAGTGYTWQDSRKDVASIAGDLLNGTQFQIDAEMALYEEKYRRLDELRKSDLISEQTANQAYLQLIEQQKQKMIQLYVEVAQKRLENGVGTWVDFELAAIGRLMEGFTTFEAGATDIMSGFFKSFSDGFANSIGRAIVYSEDLGESLRDVARQALASLISGFIKLGIQWLINAAIGKAVQTTMAKSSASVAQATAAAWAPAAAMVSLATAGANAVPATAGIALTTAMSQAMAMLGGKGFSEGGYTGNYGTNQIAGVVHGKEYVVNARATAQNRDLLEAMNAGAKITSPAALVPVSGNQSGTGAATVNVSIVNEGTYKDFTVEQLTPNDIRIIARDEAQSVVAKETPKHVSNQLAKPNSRISKALAGSVSAERRR